MDALGTRLVVGLGNPGRRYQGTRHNIGFLVVEELVRRWDASGPRQAFSGLVWEARPGGRRVLLMQPQTFMNRSGAAVAELVRFYKAALADVIVVLDDMALPPGRIRVRPGGSAGGHHGLEDVLMALGDEQVPRIRIGIGGPPGPMEGVDYVLGVMGEDELAVAREAIDRACQAVEDWLSADMATVMNRYNREQQGE